MEAWQRTGWQPGVGQHLQSWQLCSLIFIHFMDIQMIQVAFLCSTMVHRAYRDWQGRFWTRLRWIQHGHWLPGFAWGFSTSMFVYPRVPSINRNLSLVSWISIPVRKWATTISYLPYMWEIPIPIGSMYAIYGNIYHPYIPNVSICTIHGSYGIVMVIYGSLITY